MPAKPNLTPSSATEAEKDRQTHRRRHQMFPVSTYPRQTRMGGDDKTGARHSAKARHIAVLFDSNLPSIRTGDLEKAYDLQKRHRRIPQATAAAPVPLPPPSLRRTVGDVSIGNTLGGQRRAAMRIDVCKPTGSSSRRRHQGSRRHIIFPRAAQSSALTVRPQDRPLPGMRADYSPAHLPATRHVREPATRWPPSNGSQSSPSGDQ